MKTLLGTLLLLVSMVDVVGAQKGNTPPLPADLAYVAEKAEDIIDYYQGGEWQNAQAVVDSMSAREESVEAELHSDNLPASSAYLFDYFLFELRELTRQQTNSLAAALAANQITALLIDAQGHYAHSVPLEIAWMDYLGREIVLLAQYPDDRLTLNHRLAELGQIWSNIESDIKSRNGSEVAAKVNEVMTKLRQTESRPEMITGAGRLLELVDELEGLYK